MYYENNKINVFPRIKGYRHYFSIILQSFYNFFHFSIILLLFYYYFHSFLISECKHTKYKRTTTTTMQIIDEISLPFALYSLFSNFFNSQVGQYTLSICLHYFIIFELFSIISRKKGPYNILLILYARIIRSNMIVRQITEK